MKLEPIEEVTIEVLSDNDFHLYQKYCFFLLSFTVVHQVNEEHVGLVMEALSHRRAEVLDMGPVAGSLDRTKLSLICPSRSCLLQFDLNTI